MKLHALAAGALALAGASSTFGAWHTSEAAFLANVNPNFYLEEFNSFTFGTPLDGTQSMWNAPGANGYGWMASAANGLYANNSALSTNFSNTPLVINFTGNAVTAIGGIFTNTDISGNIIPGTVTLTLSNGDIQQLTDPTSGTFVGWTGSVAISSITITATSGAINNWAQLDHFYTGSAIPAPGALAALVIAAAARRRRRA